MNPRTIRCQSEHPSATRGCVDCFDVLTFHLGVALVRLSRLRGLCEGELRADGDLAYIAAQDVLDNIARPVDLTPPDGAIADWEREWLHGQDGAS